MVCLGVLVYPTPETPIFPQQKVYGPTGYLHGPWVVMSKMLEIMQLYIKYRTMIGCMNDFHKTMGVYTNHGLRHKDLHNIYCSLCCPESN